MSLLLTAPYDPWKQTDWVSHIIGLASQMQQAREKDAITRQQHEDQMRQQGLADQRRAFEFDRRLEFDRARTAADDTRADRTLANSEAENAPFVVPGAVGPPSSSVPALPTADGNSDGTSSDDIAPLPTLDAPDGTGATGETATAVPATDTTADRIPGIPDDLPGTPADVSKIPGMPGAPPITLEDGTPAPAPPPSAKVPRLPVSGAPTADATMPLMPASPILPPTTHAPRTPAENVAEIARSLSGSGLSKKQATGVIAHVASTMLAKDPSITGETAAASKPIVRNFADGSTQQWDATNKTWVKLAEKKAGESETIADAVGDAKYNKEHGTYQRPDGSEFFLNKGANGKFTQRSFRPDQKPAKILWGSDGEIYPHDAHGQPLKPVPDGVTLRDHASMQVAKTPGGGVMIVDPDGTLKPLIPEGIKMDAKSQDKYVDAAKTLRQAQVELDTQTKLLHDNPGTTGWFGGGTKEAVAAAQKKFDDAKGEVEGIRKTFPQLNPGAMPGPAGQAPGQAPTKYPIGSTAVKDGKTYVRTATGWVPQ